MSGFQGLGSLPSEVLLHILTLLDTRELLPLTRVSYRLHSLIVRVLHARIVRAAPPAGLELILDCYRPAAKYSEPAFNCVYLGTDGLEELSTKGALTAGSPGERLKRLNGLYSRFRPHRRPEPKPRWHPAGDIPGSRTYARSTRAAQQAEAQAQSFQAETYPRPRAPDRDAGQNGAPPHGTVGHVDVGGAAPTSSSSSRDGSSFSDAGARAPVLTALTEPHPGTEGSSSSESLPTVKIPVHLDGSELFTQLCTNAMLVIPGPKSGLFRSSVPVHDCIIRVFRHWLASEAAAEAAAEAEVVAATVHHDDREHTSTSTISESSSSRYATSSYNGKAKSTQATSSSSPLVDERGIIWSNKSKQICMRFKVRERTWRRRQSNALDDRSVPSADPSWLSYNSSSDDLPVSYELEFQEILIRTSHLLFKMEEARTQLHDCTGKAMVFGQFS